MEHSHAMALTHAGWSLRLRLPRWDHHVVERLDRAGIELLDAPRGVFSQPVVVDVGLPVDDDQTAREQVMQALRGWTIVLPFDFLESSPR
jgi:hypothetical protein